MKFTYTKANGDVSERETLVLKSPTHLYTMLDLSDLSEEEKVQVYDDWKKMNDEIEQVRAKYQTIQSLMKTNCKTFKKDNISNVKE